MSSDYWLGVVTTPALFLASFAALVAYARTINALDRRGYTFELKNRRNLEAISDYTLSHDIWWEKSHGPVFVGGWYCELPEGPRFNRWIGIGSADGPCLMMFKSRHFDRKAGASHG